MSLFINILFFLAVALIILSISYFYSAVRETRKFKLKDEALIKSHDIKGFVMIGLAVILFIVSSILSSIQ